MPIKVGAGQGNKVFDELVNSLNKISSDAIQGGQGDTNLGKAGSGVNARAQQNGVRRTPWIMSTTEWLTGNPPKALLWASNPGDVSWTMAQRSTHSKNLFGTVLHVWPDNYRDTFYDELRLTFNLQSGNIMPLFVGNSSSTLSNSSNWQIAPGLANFYDFMLLVDAPKLTASATPGPDGKPSTRANLVSIQYASNLFPSLTLLGMFEPSGIRFTDSSNNPNMVSSWTADFLVYDTYPRLSDYSGQASNASLLSKWLDDRVRNIL